MVRLNPVTMSVATPRSITPLRAPPHYPELSLRSRQLAEAYGSDGEDVLEPTGSPPRSVASFGAPTVTPFDSVSQAGYREWRRRSRTMPTFQQDYTRPSPRWEAPRASRRGNNAGPPRLTEQNLYAHNVHPRPPPREPTSARRDFGWEGEPTTRRSHRSRVEEPDQIRTFRARLALSNSDPESARTPTARRLNAQSAATSWRGSHPTRSSAPSSDSLSSASSATEPSTHKARTTASSRTKSAIPPWEGTSRNPTQSGTGARFQANSHEVSPSSRELSRSPSRKWTSKNSRSWTVDAPSLAQSMDTYIVEVERIDDKNTKTPYTIHRKHKYPVYDSPK